VEVEAQASIWFGAVLRGDQNLIHIGRGSNVQDNCVIHCADDLPTVVEADVTVGHGALLEGCVVEQGALVGMGAVLLQRSRLGAGSMLAAGAVLGEGQAIPPRHLAAGVPAQLKKELSGSAENWVGRSAAHYRELARSYGETLTPGD
jgi:carbonic anhydrase/acetyltransferase-like protein (isoleucine patch superfamily)